MRCSMLCIIDVIHVRAVAYQRDTGEWEIVESSMPGMVSAGSRAASSTVIVVASPGDIVQTRARQVVRFCHLAPGSTGWVAVVSDGKNAVSMDPYMLESAE